MLFLAISAQIAYSSLGSLISYEYKLGIRSIKCNNELLLINCHFYKPKLSIKIPQSCSIWLYNYRFWLSKT